MTEWKDITKEKPKNWTQHIVINMKYGKQIFMAMYDPDYDVFIHYNPDSTQTICLDITHWIEIPALPAMN
jgi:hypothetical protein